MILAETFNIYVNGRVLAKDPMVLSFENYSC